VFHQKNRHSPSHHYKPLVSMKCHHHRAHWSSEKNSLWWQWPGAPLQLDRCLVLLVLFLLWVQS
jgi:hypothetical protein